MLSPEQEAELKRFTAEKTRVRKELRETQRGLDVDINRLDARLKIINIGIAPLIVALAGVVILSMRRRRRAASSRPRRRECRHEPPAIHRPADRRARRDLRAFILSTQRNLPRDIHGPPLLPALASELDTVTSLSVLQGRHHARGHGSQTRRGMDGARAGELPGGRAETAQIAAGLERCQDSRRKDLQSGQLFDNRRRRPDQSGRDRRADRAGCKRRQARRHCRQTRRGGQLCQARRGEKPATSSNPGSPSKPSPATGSIRGCSIFPADKIQSIEFKPATGPAIRVRRVAEPQQSPRPTPKADRRENPAGTHGSAPLTPPPRPANSYWMGCRADDRLPIRKRSRLRPIFSAVWPMKMFRRPGTSTSASPDRDRHLDRRQRDHPERRRRWR